MVFFKAFPFLFLVFTRKGVNSGGPNALETYILKKSIDFQAYNLYYRGIEEHNSSTILLKNSIQSCVEKVIRRVSRYILRGYILNH